MATDLFNNLQQSSKLPLSAQAPEVKDYSEKKAACRAKGGKWDSVSNTCIMPEVKEKGDIKEVKRNVDQSSGTAAPGAVPDYRS